MTISPPYCGVPSLAHQFPFTGVVELCAVVEEVVEVDVFVVVVVLVVVVDVVVVVVVVLVQDTKTSDITVRQVSIIQIAPLFIITSLLFIENVMVIYNQLPKMYSLIFYIEG